MLIFQLTQDIVSKAGGLSGEDVPRTAAKVGSPVERESETPGSDVNKDNSGQEEYVLEAWGELSSPYVLHWADHPTTETETKVRSCSFGPIKKLIINRQTTIKRALPPSALKTTVDLSFEEMVQRLKETKNKKGRHSHRNSADKRLKLGKDQSTAP